MAYICSHSTYLVANGYNGKWQGESCQLYLKAVNFILAPMNEFTERAALAAAAWAKCFANVISRRH